MTNMSSVFLYSPELEKVGYPDACPFNTSRAGRTRKILQSMGLLVGDGKMEVPPVRATREELGRFHSPDYLDVLEKAGRGELDLRAGVEYGLATPDCPVFNGLYEYATLASGASITGARLLLSGEAKIAFNPSGGYHHAGPNYAAGFCYINDIVLAAMTLTAAGKRVLFLDLDVHHCDGVQNAFYERKDVMTISMHESGKTLFPGTGFANEIGKGEGLGYSVNLPLPVGTYDGIYVSAFTSVVLPLMKAHDPDVIIVELGMDTLAGDPLAHLHLTNNVYAEIIPMVLKLGKPVLATGGGGYHVENTARGWALCWTVLTGSDTMHDWSFGMGGVMLENTDWAGGLRDRMLLSDAGRRGEVDLEVDLVVDVIKKTVFPIHGLSA